MSEDMTTESLENVGLDGYVGEELPLSMTGDYHGLGGPESVVGSPEAFEKPPTVAATFLADLFMAPSDETIKSYQITERKRTIAKTKGYISFLLYVHLLGAVIMLAKLSPAIFDYLDIFILSLEEQNIPKPLLWEWVWFGGSLVTFVFGGHAIKTSRPGKIQIFGGLTLILGLLPILWVLLIYWTDFYAAIFEKQSKVYQSWKGYPVAVFWYIFGINALFVHVYELNCAYILNDAWSLKRKTA